MTQRPLNTEDLKNQNADNSAAVRLQEMISLRVKNHAYFFGTFLSQVEFHNALADAAGR